jgi:hypothetical protein
MVFWRVGRRMPGGKSCWAGRYDSRWISVCLVWTGEVVLAVFTEGRGSDEDGIVPPDSEGLEWR